MILSLMILSSLRSCNHCLRQNHEHSIMANPEANAAQGMRSVVRAGMDRRGPQAEQKTETYLFAYAAEAGEACHRENYRL
jgi:hypothetical protein